MSRPNTLIGNLLLVALALWLPSRAGAQPGPVFQDRTAALGLELSTNMVCLVDVDQDGWVDLVDVSGIWKNNEGKGFTKLAPGLGGSVVAADYDNDGYPDLFNYQTKQLYHNDGGKGFTEVKLPELPKMASLGACWGDFNGDGWVDLFIGGYEDWNADLTYPDLLLLNDHGRGFKLAWSEVRYRTRGVTACDFNEDGALDVYLSNYRLMPNELLLNDGTGKFRDAAAEYNVVATTAPFEGGHSIGAAWGDFDNDGLFDLFAGNFAHVDDRGDQPKSRFLRNLGPRQGYHFQDLGPCGVFYQESYATPAAGDYDNDGYLDLFFTTVYGGASFGVPNFPVLYHNEVGFEFTDATAGAGLAGLAPTNVAAWADFNHDGNLDLVTAGKLFVNQGGGGNHWLEIRLSGDGVKINRSAIGAQVRIKLGDQTLTRQVEAGTGEGNQNDLTLHFGLGKHAGPVNLEIMWPGVKQIQTLKNVPVDRVMAVQYGGARG
jgi:hypothetical protein